MSAPVQPIELRAFAHFRGLPIDLLTDLARISTRRGYVTGDTLFLEGDPCRSFFAIASGRVKLYRATLDGREHSVHHLRSGATVADAALLVFGRFPASAGVTHTPTELFEIAGEPFLRMFRSDSRLAPAMVASLSMRLIALVERVEELGVVQAGPRLARWLLRQPASAEAVPVVELALSKKELAAHLAMTPETLSRLLRRWQLEGWVENQRASIRLLQPAALVALVEGHEQAPRAMSRAR